MNLLFIGGIEALLIGIIIQAIICFSFFQLGKKYGSKTSNKEQ